MDNCLTALPVGLTNLRLQHSDLTSLLLWETESEENSDYFTVQRSDNGSNFESLGIVDAKENSDQKQFYQFADSYPIQGISYYRLKIVDLNGSIRYSSVLSSKRMENSVQIIPNPNAGSFQVSGLTGSNQLELSDLQGKTLQWIETNEETVSFETGLKTGVYVLRISNSKGSEMLRISIK